MDIAMSHIVTFLSRHSHGVPRLYSSDMAVLWSQARRLTIPVESVDWMIGALVKGHLPHPIRVLPLPMKRRTAPEPQAAGISSPEKEVAAAQDAEPPAQAAEDGNGELVEDSESFGEAPFEIRPSLASVGHWSSH